MVANKSLTPPNGSSGTGIGSGIMIGDGLLLTAGHVMFEFNERDDPADRDIRTLSGSSLVYDPRDYYDQYLTRVEGFSDPLPSGIPSGQSFSQFHIERFLTQSDMVVVSRSGSVDDSDAGMALYLSPIDIVSPDGSLVDGTRYRRWGQTTGTETVDWQSLTLSSTGLSWSDSGAQLDGGDSGGANYISFEGREFIVGVNVSVGSTVSNASYIRSDEFYELNGIMSAAQVGDVTFSEPTNLIIGSVADDNNANGTYRADIILGKGGNDVLWDGEDANSSVWANDQLFGGGGDDIFRAANGNDLLHGGDHRIYDQGTQRTWSIEADGIDSVDYSSLTNDLRTKDDPGVELRIGSAEGSPIPSWVYGDAANDQHLASYVIDLWSDASSPNGIGVDALISIEDITLTISNDVLTVNELGSERWAGTDGTGGIRNVDMQANSDFDGTKDGAGDVVDASNLGATQHVRIDLETGLLSAVPGNGPSGRNVPSLQINGAESAYGGAGNDELMGDANGNRLDGGSGVDRLFGAAGDDFLVFDGEDRTVDGGADFDTAVVDTDYNESGEAIGQSFDISGFRSLSSIERIWGTEGDDIVVIGTGDYTFDGRGGDDHITVSGRAPVTIEFGIGGGNDVVSGLFMENHDLTNSDGSYPSGDNEWVSARQNDTIRFVDLMPEDVMLVWNYETIDWGDTFGPVRIDYDGPFAIVIRETGESIQFDELHAHSFDYTNWTANGGLSLHVAYGPYDRSGWDMNESDPDTYNPVDPDLNDNYIHLDIFEFANGERYSIVDLFNLHETTSSALPNSRASSSAAIASSDLENAFESEAFANPKAYEDMGYLFNWDQIFEVPVAEI